MKYIKSEVFFNKFIKNNAIFNDQFTFDYPDHYLQKFSGSFRNAKLVPPLIFLYLESIGYQVSKDYKRLENDVRCYYAGNLLKKDSYYRNSYNEFYLDINESSRHYGYYIKFDVSNFFESIDINRLFQKINAYDTIIDLRTELIYKRLLQSIGNYKFPIIENSSTLSYLATYVYLDSFDNEIDTKVNNIEFVSDYQIVRYVDDLYIFFNTEECLRNIVFANIKNLVINEYQRIGLSLNESKTSLGLSKNVNEDLMSALYEHYVNEKNINIVEFFSEESIINFLKELESIPLSHNHIKYYEILNQHFNAEGITYSPTEVFRYLVYYKSNLFKQRGVIKQLQRLIEKDYTILKYNTDLFVSIILNTEDGELIRFLLNNIFRLSKLDYFDKSIIVRYLILRNFKHQDLLERISEGNQNLVQYINKYCRGNFMNSFVDEKNNRFISMLDKKQFDFHNDSKVWYLYFMYKYHFKNGDILEAFAYFKTYFDRMTSILMFYKKVKFKKNRPDYHRHYEVKNAKKDYKSLNEMYYFENDIDDLLTRLYKKRNFNPVIHSSAQIIDKEMINKATLIELINKSEKLIVESFESEM